MHAAAQLRQLLALRRTFMPAATVVVHEAGKPCGLRSPPGTARQEPNALSVSVAHSFGTCTPGERRGAHDRRALGHRDRRAVDLERDRALSPLRGRRAEVFVINGKHDRAPQPAGRARARKSCGKCLSALCTGNGVMPPRPHKRSVQHRLAQVFEQLQILVRGSTPARMRSITSTPRVEPMRHGVHLPQDSMAQNSIA